MNNADGGLSADARSANARSADARSADARSADARSADALFTIHARDPGSAARAGTLRLPHGDVATPAFMPVGTNATVKALSREDLAELGFNLILANTYHLYLRPGIDVIAAAGGLRRFMAWPANILTDSGGFQIFSLAPFRRITEAGARFRSHIDGSEHLLTPEAVVEAQAALDSDIQMQLDVCSPWGAPRRDIAEALAVTTRWMDRAMTAWRRARSTGYRGLLFPIVQGGFERDLREESAGRVTAAVEAARAAGAPATGIAIGGLSVGEPRDVFLDLLAFTASRLPPDLPRYVMGIGTPEYLLAAIENGVDLFDCVLPTREARNGRVFTRDGPLSVKRAENARDFRPIDPECGCKVCRAYSRAYLRHLFKSGEILSSMLTSYHNLYFLRELVEGARAAIAGEGVRAYARRALGRYRREAPGRAG